MNYKEKKEELLKKIEAFTESIDQMHQSLNDLIEEEKKEEFITVVDGWRGSLKLKECWVRDGVDSSWHLFNNVEIICRHDKTILPYTIILEKNNTIPSFRFLKFRPFSPENPPPVDWPVEISDYGESLFKEYSSSGPNMLSHEVPQHMFNSDRHIYIDSDVEYVKFLNIEPVEN